MATTPSTSALAPASPAFPLTTAARFPRLPRASLCARRAAPHAASPCARGRLALSACPPLSMSSPCPPLVALRPGISHEGGQIQGRRQGRCQVGKAAGYRWKSLSDAVKAPYVAKVNKLKTEYNKGCRP